jgi:L,D-peptidoglycan transpeptidase YkuD (ErfK/YbiS/YcfS/YnhG family)
VNRLRASVSAGRLSFGDESLPASFGRAGACAAADKREGDGRTPMGTWSLMTALLRPDRGLAAPRTALPWRWLRPWDGWSDDVADPAYNRPVRHPHPRSAEHLWREDGAYDIIIALAHNTPPVPGLGSAIFLHCLQPDNRPTQGCVAIARETLHRWLADFTPATRIEIGT